MRRTVGNLLSEKEDIASPATQTMKVAEIRAAAVTWLWPFTCKRSLSYPFKRLNALQVSWRERLDKSLKWTPSERLSGCRKFLNGWGRTAEQQKKASKVNWNRNTAFEGTICEKVIKLRKTWSKPRSSDFKVKNFSGSSMLPDGPGGPLLQHSCCR